MGNPEADKTQFLSDILQKVDGALAAGDMSLAEGLITTILQPMADSAIRFTQARALTTKDSDREAFFRAIRIIDRLAMLRGGVNYPQKPLFFLWQAENTEIQKVWRRAQGLRRLIERRPRAFITQLTRLNYYDTDACAKVANCWLGILMLRNSIDPSRALKQEIGINQRLVQVLLGRAKILQRPIKT